MEKNLAKYLIRFKNSLKYRDFILDLFSKSEIKSLEANNVNLDSKTIVSVPDGFFVYPGKLFLLSGSLYFISEVDEKTNTSKFEKADFKLNQPLLNPSDKMTIASKDIENCTASSLETTVGRFLANQVLLVDNFGNSIPYVNEQWNVRKIERIIAKKAIDDDDSSNNVTVTVNTEGKFEITNPTGGASLQISVSAGSQNNQKLLDIMSPLEGTIPPDGSSKISQALYSATHASSIDIYDSLGTKHTLRTSFRKISQNNNTSTWEMVLSVPDPGEINTTSPKNYIAGTISFNSDGSLSTFTPTSISFTGNNGSAPKQTVQLALGTANQFDGMTSFDATSSTSGISQDGYPGGDLKGIRVDETGTLIGSFSNGRSFGLAQVSMATFANNVGLESAGNGTYIQTSNSGDPIIGQANTGKRGGIVASSLEMSNVDLSRSLTQLIVVQRGFQANSKTITTSDQMLQTLLQLKR